MKNSDLDRSILQIVSFGKHQKVMRRIVFGMKEGFVGSGKDLTLRELLGLDPEELRKIPHVGDKYISLFRELKDEFSENSDLELGPIVENAQDAQHLALLAEAVELNKINLTKDDVAALDRVQSSGFDISVKSLIELSIQQLLSISGLGKSTVSRVSEIRSRCLYDLKRACKGEIDIESYESDIVLPTSFKNINCEKIDALILEDIESFFEMLTEKEQTVFTARWGFTTDKETLESVGETLALTRERVRQLEKKINERFRSQKRLDDAIIKSVVQSNLDFGLASYFPFLAECFDTESNFVAFLEFCCGGLDIKGKLNPDIDRRIIHDLFTQEGAPLSKTDILEYLESSISTDINLDLALEFLVNENVLSVRNGLVFPTNLTKPDTVACILAKNPNGLPWKDIAKIANTIKVGKAIFSETRTDDSAYGDSEDVYLSGKGTYSHTKYLNVRSDQVSTILSETSRVLAGFSRNAAHLNEIIASSKKLSELNYYSIRYVVKMQGVDEGIYFNGRSQTDTVSLEQGFKPVNQKDVILERLRSEHSALTKGEIAQLLKSKSLFHASLYVDELMRDKKVVQVDRMLYTTPEKAFDGIEFGQLGYFLKEFIERSSKPVHASAVQPLANSTFDYSYSSRFYEAFLKFWCDDLGLYRSSNFYCGCPMSFKTFGDFLDQNIDLSFSYREAMQVVNENLAVGDTYSQTAYWNWRASRSI